MTLQVTGDAAGRRRKLAPVLRRRDVGRQIARSGYNIATATTAGPCGIIVAPTLGSEMRGEYAAVTAWFGVVLMVGDMGQPAALCFPVTHDPGNARSYVVTSRAMMPETGTAALAGGILLAPLLARGNTGMSVSYRIAFATSIAVFVGGSYTFLLPANNLRGWNTVRVSQPVLSPAFLVVLWRLRLLTLTAALIVLALALLHQLGWAYYRWRSADLAPGHAQARLVRPLAWYGIAQIAAVTPAALNADLDQPVLSQALPPTALGWYAIAVSFSLLPLVSAIGNVAFRRLASRQRVDGLAGRMQWLCTLGTACAATAALVPPDLVASRLILHAFRPRYAALVPLLWILTPAGVFLACNQVTGDMLRQEGPAYCRPRPRTYGRVHGNPAGGPPACRCVHGAVIVSALAYGVALVIMLLSLRMSLRRLPPDSPGTRQARRPVDLDPPQGA